MLRARMVVQNAITGTLVLCAVLVTATLVHREFFSDKAAAGLISRHVSDWKPLTIDRPPVMGVASAPVQIILFSDYQCPFCKDLEPKLQTVVSRYPGKVAVLRYEFPLTKVHPEAYNAAIAAKCAAQQEIHQTFQAKLFENSPNLSKLDWASLAGSAGVRDTNRFLVCIQQKQTAHLVDLDIATGARLGINSVPVFLINGDVVVGTQDQRDLEKLVSATLSDG